MPPVASGYRVHASTTGYPEANKFTYVMSGFPPFSLNGLKPGTTYYYRVAAVDKAGNVSPGATLKARTKAAGLPFLQLLLGD